MERSFAVNVVSHSLIQPPNQHHQPKLSSHSLRVCENPPPSQTGRRRAPGFDPFLGIIPGGICPPRSVPPGRIPPSRTRWWRSAGRCIGSKPRSGIASGFGTVRGNRSWPPPGDLPYRCPGVLLESRPWYGPKEDGSPGRQRGREPESAGQWPTCRGSGQPIYPS